MGELNIICWLWRQKNGSVRYTAKHVNFWARQVQNHLSLPHRLTCMTDMPEGIDSSINIQPLPTSTAFQNEKNWKAHRGKPQCYVRLDAFRKDAADVYGERFVMMDLDCVINKSLDSLFSREEDFIMYKGTSPTRPYNGSMLMMTAGARSEVFEKFTPAGALKASAKFLGSDQAWISYVLGPGEAVWDKPDGVYFFGRNETRQPSPPPNLRVLFFPGIPKPWDVKNVRWIKQACNECK